MLGLITWAIALELPAVVGACESPAPTPLAQTLADTQATNATLAAQLSGPICRPAAGGTPSVELAPLDAIPPAEGAPTSWAEEHPLIVDTRMSAVNLSRWPMPGVDTPDRATAEQLLRLDRRSYPTRRRAVLVAEPSGAAVATDGWIGSLARAGYTSVDLLVLPEYSSGSPVWSAPVTVTDTLEQGLVRAPERVVVNEQGDFTIRFPDSLGIPPMDVPLQDIQGFERTCSGGTCEVLLLTSDIRILVNRATEPTPDDLVRRWLFGVPVHLYTGPSVRPLRAPTLEGGLRAAPIWSWTGAVRRTDRDARHLIALRGNLLIRPCWMKIWRAWRSLPFLFRNPLGTLKLRVAVQADGRVSGVEVVGSDIDNPRVQTCAVQGIRVMRLPRPTDGQPYVVDTSYKFGVD